MLSYKGDMKKSSRVNNIRTAFPLCILALFYSLLILSFNNINVFYKIFLLNINVLQCDIKQNLNFDL